MDIGENMPVSDARANITEVINHVRILRGCVVLTNRERPVAGVVPPDLALLIRRAGVDVVAEMIREHLGPEGDEE